MSQVHGLCLYLCLYFFSNFSVCPLYIVTLVLQAVAKISSMFPTVEESHIRDLYKKCVPPLSVLTNTD